MKDTSEDMTFKVLRGLTYEEAYELIDGFDLEDLNGSIAGMSNLLDPILLPYNWSVEKMINEITRRHFEERNGNQRN